MSDDVYRRLALRLDAVPNGFPATESGVELRLLAKLFTPEQATLAAEMRMAYEPAEDIAARAGVDPSAAYRTLKAMAKRGLIYAGRGDAGLAFRLMPFVVGIYEEQLPRLDAELAELFEAYLQESRGSTIYGPTPVHRVIPVSEAVPVDLEIFPYESAAALIDGAKSWGVRDCICRMQKRLIGEGCEHPVQNCLIFAPVEGVFDHSEDDPRHHQGRGVEHSAGDGGSRAGAHRRQLPRRSQLHLQLLHLLVRYIAWRGRVWNSVCGRSLGISRRRRRRCLRGLWRLP